MTSQPPITLIIFGPLLNPCRCIIPKPNAKPAPTKHNCALTIPCRPVYRCHWQVPPSQPSTHLVQAYQSPSLHAASDRSVPLLSFRPSPRPVKCNAAAKPVRAPGYPEHSQGSCLHRVSDAFRWLCWPSKGASRFQLYHRSACGCTIKARTKSRDGQMSVHPSLLTCIPWTYG